MSKTYKEWLDYYSNATKEQVIEELTIDNQEIERLNNIITETTKYVESLSSKGRDCEIYWDIKQEILKKLKGSDKE